MHLSHGATDHLRAENHFVGAEDVLRGVVSIDMRRDEVHRYMVFDTVAYEAIDPSRLRRGRATHPETGVHGLQRPSRHVVEMIVGLLFWIASPEVEVRLVPDFKIPLRDFIDSVALDKMLCKMRNEVIPLLVARWRRNDRGIPEWM